MTRTITLLLISLGVLLALVTAASQPPSCPKDKVYDRCGSLCPPTCEKLNPTCPEKCVAGCFCPNGTVQNSWGECVEREKCKFCSGNTTYSYCANNCPGVVSPPDCLRIACRHGCACKPNYALIFESNRCVLPQDLPKSDYDN